MAKKKKRRPYVPVPENFTLWKRLIEQLRLSWALFLDGRVPTASKIIPILAVAYAISPLDLVPDLFLFIGQLDDLSIFLIAISVFISIAPAAVVEEHTRRLRSGALRQVSRDEDGLVIDVKAEYVPEDEDGHDHNDEGDDWTTDAPRTRRATRR